MVNDREFSILQILSPESSNIINSGISFSGKIEIGSEILLPLISKLWKRIT
jgi:hypothetical protein